MILSGSIFRSLLSETLIQKLGEAMLASVARGITNSAKQLNVLYVNIRTAAENGKDSIEANLVGAMSDELKRKGYRITVKPDEEDERFPHIISW